MTDCWKRSAPYAAPLPEREAAIVGMPFILFIDAKDDEGMHERVGRVDKQWCRAYGDLTGPARKANISITAGESVAHGGHEQHTK